MIAVDTSAILAVVFGEKQSDACIHMLEAETNALISAGSVAECFVVAARRGVTAEIERVMDGYGFDVVTVTKSTAIAVGDAYRKWGKGIHPAGLNFGDCFAYVLAKQNSCPLLYVGDEFARTDVHGVL